MGKFWQLEGSAMGNAIGVKTEEDTTSISETGGDYKQANQIAQHLQVNNLIFNYFTFLD